MTVVIYIAVGFVSLYMFGSSIHTNVLDNVNEETDATSYVIRVAFLIVLACHIPYIFFSGKESLLIILDEVMRNSMSKSLYKKLSTEITEETP